MAPTEDQVAEWVRPWLVTHGYTLLQFVSPGGQATLSVTFKGSDGKRRTVFPDVLCMHADHILVAEMKARKSQADCRKLTNMIASVDATTHIVRLCARIADGAAPLAVRYALIHGQRTAPADDSLPQIVVTSLGAAVELAPRVTLEPAAHSTEALGDRAHR